MQIGSALSQRKPRRSIGWQKNKQCDEQRVFQRNHYSFTKHLLT